MPAHGLHTGYGLPLRGRSIMTVRRWFSRACQRQRPMHEHGRDGEGGSVGDHALAGDEDEHEIPFAYLVADVWSAVVEPTVLVVRSRSVWVDLWSRATASRQPPPDPPEVDWSANWVLFVATGPRPTTGYNVEICRLVRQGHTVHVYAVETLPPPKAVTGCAVTHPIHAVTTPREPEGVRFQFHIQRKVPEQ
ncbi:protease complex subunit PrcB family protein [Streptomyces sp. NPDC005799]|uniref:protease complex subunit PrcB family protein n=1 Tax=Streptomyces sp. NPDC005799 TaxID=3154678 RepID=UPI0033C7870F